MSIGPSANRGGGVAVGERSVPQTRTSARQHAYRQLSQSLGQVRARRGGHGRHAAAAEDGASASPQPASATVPPCHPSVRPYALLVVLLARHARRARAALEVRLPVAPGWPVAARSTYGPAPERRGSPSAWYPCRVPTPVPVRAHALLLGPQGGPAHAVGPPPAGGRPHGLLRKRCSERAAAQTRESLGRLRVLLGLWGGAVQQPLPCGRVRRGRRGRRGTHGRRRRRWLRRWLRVWRRGRCGRRRCRHG